jgi:glycine/D-amino acid oxidase-like deaminating enzyme
MDLRSGYPYWLIKNGLPFDYPKLEKEIKAEVIIMGGGISGALAGYYLANAGVDCAIVDARTIGLGSTCASTALLQYEIDVSLTELSNKIGTDKAVRSYRLCAESIGKLGGIAEKIGFADFEYRKSLYYAANKKDTAFLQKEYAARKAMGLAVSYLDKAAVNEQFGFSAPGAILSELAAQTNAYAFTHALHQYSTTKGVRVFDRTVIRTIEHKNDTVKLVTNDGIELTAGKLIYANGYEAVNYVDKKIVQLHSTYAVISEHTTEAKQLWKDNAVLWNTADPYLYVRTTSDGRILVGGRDEKFYDPRKRDRLLPKKEKALVKDFTTLFPSIAFKPEFSWAGTFGATKDGLPFIGNYKKLPNSLFALGFGGNGITFSLIAAEILTDIITGRPNEDAALFSFQRT